MRYLCHANWTKMDNTISFYSILEVATRLNLSIKTIRRHIASGELDSTKIGNVYRIPHSAVEGFINKIGRAHV